MRLRSSQFTGAITLSFVLLFCGSIGDAQNANDAAVQQDLKAMAGTWKEHSRIRDGQSLPSSELGAFRQGVDGGVTLLGPKAPPGLAYSVKLDPTTNPKHIDAAAPTGTRLGIYELTANSLRICLARPGQPRPTMFASPKGADLVLSVYSRETR